MPLLPAGLPQRATLDATLTALLQRGLDVGAALRVLRHLVLERLAVLDVEQGQDLASVTGVMTDLAELALETAFQHTLAELDALHGAPQCVTEPCWAAAPEVGAAAANPAPRRAGFWIVGMGKLGARELNVSSDIDLIYLYEQDGETSGRADGRGRISNQEYFAQAVKRIFALVGESTEHGQVFRVDLALRPNGNSGPPALSLDALEEYFLVQGREWERFAWLKSRVVAPQADFDSPPVQALRALVQPFVFRRYLDYNVFEALRVLHRQIREHAAKRAAGQAGRLQDVKLSRGGIREIEFTVQLLQVVRAGQFPELRTRATLEALPRLVRAGLMRAERAEELAQAYALLRRIEHRIQYLDDQQTHLLPTRDDDLLWIARSLGYADTPSFLSALDTLREMVAIEFDALLGLSAVPGAADTACGCRNTAVCDDWPSLLAQLPPLLAQPLAAWVEQPRVQGLRDSARQRLQRLLLRTGAWLEEGRIEAAAVQRLCDWIEPLLRRESYLALLLERPAVHERLLRLLGAAQWPARYLLRHPGVIDDLAGQQLFQERFDAVQFESDLEARRLALAASGEDDDEELLDLLRRAHHAEVFRTLARDVEGVLSVEQVADDLSALADAVLRVTSRWCWQRLKQRHCEEPRHAIIGYGKLGGKELGYGSDLDIVFVYDDADERAPEVYAALVRKLINWLTVKTGEGDLYEIDTALRPNGNSGLLVTHFKAFQNYQLQRGSNTAWTWEHQAITRARCVLGPPELAQRFEDVRRSVLGADRNHADLAQQILAMRARLRAAHPVPSGRYDLKHSPGGMIDVEFVVQYLVLAHAAAHPALCANSGNIALLHAAEQAGLLPAGVGLAAARAYRALRQRQHRCRLDEASTQIDPAQVAEHRAAVQALWAQVFGPHDGTACAGPAAPPHP